MSNTQDYPSYVNQYTLRIASRVEKAKSLPEYLKEVAHMENFGLSAAYYNMVRRCNDKSIKSHGGRGIKNEWKGYLEFRKDMYKSYLKHLKDYGKRQTMLDRIDGDGNYRKENCRWVTCSQNAINQRKNEGKKSSKYKGVYYSKKEKGWRCRVTKDYKTVFQGFYNTEIEAAKMYNENVRKAHGKYATINNLTDIKS